MLRILFLGDIVGPLGREGVKAYLAKSSFDFVIANGENATHGHGLSHAHYEELLAEGVDVVTSGNHFYNCKDPLTPGFDFSRQLRPYNFDPSCPGIGTGLFPVKGQQLSLRVTNLLGRVFTGSLAQSNPFTDLDTIVALDKTPVIHIVDFHAEATAEKRCLAEYADGRITALVGTHTHVQTNDAKLLDKGTFFLTDVGMNGAYDSCLGDSKEGAIGRTRTGMPFDMDVPRTGKTLINGVILTVDTTTCKTVSFEIVNETF
ncbi:MAG: YmdB family metallophosphoesterase [Bacilli bacterium]|jgi:metallophosphoesterase (TIGR00282 family)|nr:YmdB family metallophosphoesterase [Bacilli bacterium]